MLPHSTIDQPPWLELSPREKEVLHLIYAGMELPELAPSLGTTQGAITQLLARAREREHCCSTMRLVIRYIDEYLGVGERWIPVGPMAAPENSTPIAPYRRRHRANPYR